MRLVRAALLILMVVAAACRGEDIAPEEEETWIGTITTAGNVTTVVNESGSVWGGTAKLVEEASIGVDAGPEEYMLGNVPDAFATDELIYVVDSQVPQVRVYDHSGVHVRDIGSRGEGPGQYTRPGAITVDAAGRIYVYDTFRVRIHAFAKDGDPLGVWPAELGVREMTATGRGTVWVPHYVRDPETGGQNYVVGEFGPDGLIGDARLPDIDFDPVETTITTRRGGVGQVWVPFTPRSAQTVVGPSGTIIAGASDRYRLEIQRLDGTVTAIEQNWAPVPVEREEAEWHRRYLVTALKAEVAPEGWNGEGIEIPSHKPAFSSLIAAPSGEIWVVRLGKGERATDCIEDPDESNYEQARETPCWRDRILLDVFDGEGRYLGDVTVPGNSFRPVHIDGNMVLSVEEDEAGIITVKRYRLVLPEEEVEEEGEEEEER